MKSEKIISDWFKLFFDKYPVMDSFYFVMYSLSDNKIELAEEDSGINGFHYSELPNGELLNSSDNIEKAIKHLKELRVDGINVIIQELEVIHNELQDKAYADNPLITAYDDVWSDENREKLTKKVDKSLQKEIPWRYVQWCLCTVKRSGEVTIEEHEI